MTKRTYPLSVQPGIPRLSDLKPGWTRLPIGNLFDVVARPANMQDDQRYRLITVRRSRGGLDLRSEMYGREISVKSQFFVESGDFLISKRQIVHGACGLVPAELDGAIVSNEYSVLQCRDILDPRYLAQLIHSTYLQQTFFHSSIGVHIEKMIFKLADWFKWQVNLPPLPEQRKIAEFLGAVDERIAQVTRKKALLEDYKKGCMQQLFSQSIRFKDDQGNDFPDWGETTIGQQAKVTTGSRDTKDRIDCGQFPFFVRSDTVERINSWAMDCEAVITSGDGVGVGKNFHYINGKFDFHQRVYAVFDFSEPLNGAFFYQFFREKFLRRVMRLSAKNSVDSVRMSMIVDMELPLPHPDEQQKIADFLSAIDKKIDLVAQELQQAKIFKKGLLQQMFVGGAR